MPANEPGTRAPVPGHSAAPAPTPATAPAPNKIDTPSSLAADSGHDKSRVDFLWRVHSYTNDYIRFADTKAGFTAGIVAALMGALIASHPFDSIGHTPIYQWHYRTWASIIALLFLLFSFGFALWAIKPRRNTSMPKGFIYWDSIAAHTSDAGFAEACRQLNEDDLELNVARHLHTLAGICKRKYDWTALAIQTGCVGGAVAGAVILTSHLFLP
jgi:hypothetical protein